MIKHSKRKKSEFKQIYDRLKKDFPTAGGYCLLHSKLVKRTDFVHEVCTWRLFHPVHWWMKAHFYSPGRVPPCSNLALNVVLSCSPLRVFGWQRSRTPLEDSKAIETDFLDWGSGTLCDHSCLPFLPGQTTTNVGFPCLLVMEKSEEQKSETQLSVWWLRYILLPLGENLVFVTLYTSLRFPAVNSVRVPWVLRVYTGRLLTLSGDWALNSFTWETENTFAMHWSQDHGKTIMKFILPHSQFCCKTNELLRTLAIAVGGEDKGRDRTVHARVPEHWTHAGLGAEMSLGVCTVF